MKNKSFHLIRHEAKIQQLKIMLSVRFTLTVIALSIDKERQMNELLAYAEIDPDILNTKYFGRIDN